MSPWEEAKYYQPPHPIQVSLNTGVAVLIPANPMRVAAIISWSPRTPLTLLLQNPGSNSFQTAITLDPSRSPFVLSHRDYPGFVQMEFQLLLSFGPNGGGTVTELIMNEWPRGVDDQALTTRGV